MTEPTGVTNTPPASSATPAKGKLAKNKMLILGGGGLAAILILSHGSKSGGGSGSGSTAGQLQAQSDALAAEQAAMVNPPGGNAPVDTGGGSYTYQGPSATTAPAVTVQPTPPNVTVNVNNKPGTPAAHPRKPPVKKHPKPKTPPKGKPNPVNKGGKHPPNQHKTGRGTKKHSPAEVESVFGSGAGQVIQGREFPGAIGHRMGAPRRGPDGMVSRDVIIDYGGRTERHIMHNNGERWTDRKAGGNPPSRGVPMVTDPIPV